MKKIAVLFCCSFVFLILSGTCFAEPSKVTSPITDPATAHEMFAEAMNNRDVEALCAMYADDAVLVLRNGGMIVRGKDNIRKVFTKMTKVIQKLTLETVYAVKSGDTMLFRSKYHSVFTAPHGDTVEVLCSGVEVLKEQPDGTWKFIIDHHAGGENLL